MGTIADRLRKRGIATEVLLAALGALFILAELALVLRVPLPSVLPWSVVSIVGAGTVLSFAIIADYFPVEIAARANGALNLLHFGWAFVVQYGIGLIVGQWSTQDGHYPVVAYQNRIRSQPRASGGRVDLVRSALAQELCQISSLLIRAAERGFRWSASARARGVRGSSP